MAVIGMTFDTVSKKFEVAVDGAPLANVRDVCIYGFGQDKYELSIVQRSQDAANGTVTYTQTLAAEQAYPELGEPTASIPSLIAALYARK